MSARLPSVLVVDDEPAVRTLLGLGLTRDGWSVRQAASGAEAVGLYQQAPADLVLIDKHMPGLDGLQTVAELLRLDPGVRCILMTGDGASDLCPEPGVVAVLAKPFSARDAGQLCRRLAAVPHPISTNPRS